MNYQQKLSQATDLYEFIRAITQMRGGKSRIKHSLWVVNICVKTKKYSFKVEKPHVVKVTYSR